MLHVNALFSLSFAEFPLSAPLPCSRARGVANAGAMDRFAAMLAALSAPIARAVATASEAELPGVLALALGDKFKAPPTRDVVARVLDATKGIVRYVASDATLDGYNEIVDVRGWEFTDFDRNPVVLDSHTYTGISNIVGKVVRHKIVGGQLIEDVQFAIDVPSNAVARLAYDMVAAEYLKACSVGFRPTRLVSKWRSSDTDELAAAVAALGLNADTAARVEVIYLKQRQIELSVCPIGANPNALSKAHQDGAVSDEGLERIARLQIEKISRQLHHTETGSSSAFPADDEEAQVRRDRAAWLRDFRHLINH